MPTDLVNLTISFNIPLRRTICSYSMAYSSRIFCLPHVTPGEVLSQARALHLEEDCGSFSLATLQPLYHLDASPVPGAKAKNGILLNIAEGLDVSTLLPSFWNHRPSSLLCPFRGLPGIA
ncbi:hypothetical protein BS47DRAFT_1155062 [Hydnum rufescens UP504]|uniref:Uncharacterized protein n=1 Tax=Hydnum rufescens UP504 TaxID=1448309 RepID=A0A9P6BB20_9AGAM|nr:hypothetical protein BS47DRAFT_1155062 [Hydnum rufescens UP504]